MYYTSAMLDVVLTRDVCHQGKKSEGGELLGEHDDVFEGGNGDEEVVVVSDGDEDSREILTSFMAFCSPTDPSRRGMRRSSQSPLPLW